jgi:hypothetical protein
MKSLSLIATFAMANMAAATSAPASPKNYTLWYTDAGICDNMNTTDPSCEHFPMGFFLNRTYFDANGNELGGTVNITTIQNGMAYLALKPSQDSILFVTENALDANTYIYNVDISNPSAPGTPQILFSPEQLQPLLVPCFPNCTEISVFHPTWSFDGSQVYFAYRAWSDEGDGIGNQAIGVANADGTNMQQFTFTTAGSFGGVEIIDMCPTPLLNDPSRLVFTRTMDQGATTYMAVVDLTTGNITFLDSLPQFAPASGCSNFYPSADGVSVLFMGCINASACGFSNAAEEEASIAPIHKTKSAKEFAWGTVPSNKVAAASRKVNGARMLQDTPSPYSYMYLTVPKGADPSTSTTTTLFNVPFTNSPDYDDTYAITQCDVVHGLQPASTGAFSCEGSDPTHGFFQRLFVDGTTGATSVISYDTFQVCMGPHCSLLSANY